MTLQNNLFMEVWQEWMEKLNKEELGIAAATVWQIWLRRNALLIHGKDFTHPDLLVKRVEEEDRAFTDQQEKNLPLNSMLEQRVSEWKAPLYDFHKVNWDASVNRLNKKIGIRELVRDHEKQVTGTFQAAENFNASAQMAESYATMMVANFF